MKSCYLCQLNDTFALELKAEHSSDPRACSRASREDVSHLEEEREDTALKRGECIGKCVCLEYDGKAYSGIVEDADMAQVYFILNCMHSVGKEMLNCFYWPRLFPDLNWYDYDQILAIIPKPLFYNKSL